MEILILKFLSNKLSVSISCPDLMGWMLEDIPN